MAIVRTDLIATKRLKKPVYAIVMPVNEKKRMNLLEGISTKKRKRKNGRIEGGELRLNMNLKTRKKMNRCFIIIAIVVPILFFLNVYNNHENEKQKIEKENEEWSSWLSKLENLECRDCGTHYRRIDSNGKYSYGCLQFQEETWIEKIHEYKIKGDIYSCEDQKILARKMFEDKGAKTASHWYTSIFVKELGLPPGIK